MNAREMFIKEVIRSILIEVRGQPNPNIRALASQWALTAREEDEVVKAVTQQLKA